MWADTEPSDTGLSLAPLSPCAETSGAHLAPAQAVPADVGLHLTLSSLARVGLPKVVVRLSVPGDPSVLQKSKSSNIQGLLGNFLGLTPSVVFLLLCFFNAFLDCLGSQKSPELIELNSKINNKPSNNTVVFKNPAKGLTESQVWKCLSVSYAIA